MSKYRLFATLVSGVVSMLIAGGSWAVNYDDSVNADLSGNWLAPTTLTLDAGSNHVNGSFGQIPVTPTLQSLPGVIGFDLDYLTVIVPTGFQLNALVLDSLNPGGANSFLGVQNGPQMTMPPTSTDPGVLLGWNHIFRNQQGANLLPVLGVSGPLAAGSYTFWINETDSSALWSYGLDFQVTAAVPEPSTYAMLLLGIGLLACAARRRRSTAA